MMFENCRSYSGKGIGAWNVASVTDMSGMFAWCEAFEGRGIGAWDTLELC